MKSLFKSIFFVAAASAALVSCEKNEIKSNDPKEIHFVINAKQVETKSYLDNNLDGTYTANWSNGDKLGIYLSTTTIVANKELDATFNNTAADGEEATFEGTLAAADEGTFYSFAPAAGMEKSYADGTIGFNVGSTTSYIQHPLQVTYDPACDLLVAKPCDYTSDGTTAVIDDLYFARLLSVLKVNLKGTAIAGEKVSEFKISFPTGSKITGRVKVDLKEASLGDWTSAKAYAAAEYAADEEPIVNDDVLNAVYLVVNPTTIASGAEVVITAKTENYTVNKTITLTKDMTFPAGQIAVLNLTLKEADCTEIPVETALTTMDQIFDKATAVGSTATDVTVVLNNWVVSGVKNNNAYVTDGTKGFIIYTSGHGFEVGDILSGTVACKVQLYKGASEITSLTSTTDGLTVTKGGAVTPATIAIADLTGANTGAILSYEKLTYNGSAFSDGTSTITPYGTFITLPTLTSGLKYDVTGVFIMFNTTKEICPLAAEDIVEVPATKYAVNVASDIANGSVSVSDTEAAEGQTITITATPADGYKLDAINVTAADNTSVTVTGKTFVMPAQAVTVSASFVVDEGGTIRTLTFTYASHKDWTVSGATDNTNGQYYILKTGASIESPAVTIKSVKSVTVKTRTYGGASYNTTDITFNGSAVGSVAAADKNLSEQVLDEPNSVSGTGTFVFAPADGCSSAANGPGVSEITIEYYE